MATYTFGPSDIASIKTRLAEGGHTIILRRGTYNIDRDTNADGVGDGVGWTIGSNITLRGEGSTNNESLSGSVGAVLVMTSKRGYTGNQGMLYMSSARNVLIENISITSYNVNKGAFGSSGDILISGVSCNNLEIRNCFFAYSAIDFIRLRTSTTVNVHHNRMWFPGHECLYILGGSGITFAYNECRTRTNSACRLSGVCNNSYIHHNDISGRAPNTYTFNGTTLGGADAHPGIELDMSGDNIQVYQNYIHDIRGAGIWIWTKSSGRPITNLLIHHNTFNSCGSNSWNYATGSIHLNEANAKIYNNRFINSRAKGRALHIYLGWGLNHSGELYIYGKKAPGTYNISFTNNVGATATDVQVVNELEALNTVEFTYAGTTYRNSALHIVTQSNNTVGAGGGYTESIGWSGGGGAPPTTPPDNPPTTTDPPVIPTPTINYDVGGLQIDGKTPQLSDQSSYNIIRTYRLDLTTYIENANRAYVRRYNMTSGAKLESETLLFSNGTGAKETKYFSEVIDFPYKVAYTISAYPRADSVEGNVFKNITINIIEPGIPIPTFKEFFSAVGGKQRNQIYNSEAVSIIASGFENVEMATIQIATEPDGLTVYENIPIINNGIRLDGITFTGTGDRLCKLLLANSKSGTATSEFYINVAAPPSLITPALSFTSNYNSIYANESIKLTWLTADATAISLKYTDGVTTDGNIVIPQSESVGYGSVYLSPAMTTSYTMTAYNGSLSKSYTLEVTVNNRPPDVYPAIRLRSSTPRIDIDQSAIIEWFTENVETLSCSGYDSLPPISGSITVSPQSNTKYIFTGYGPDEVGVTTASITIYVNRSDIVGAFVASPQIVHSGEPTTLAWMTRYAKDIYIDGVLMPSGSASAGTYVVTPTYPTTYTLLASGSMGTLEKTFDVSVMNPPGDEDIAAYFSVSNPLIMRGRTSEISWLAQNANMMSTDYEHQFVELPSGSLTVKPPISMNYQFILAKEFETAEYEVPIYVINDNYEFITSDTYQRPEEFIDISARAVYVSGGQSTTDTTYTWNVDANEAIRANPTDEMITFSFDEKGFYTITLTSVDRNGMIKMQTVRANVYI